MMFRCAILQLEWWSRERYSRQYESCCFRRYKSLTTRDVLILPSRVSWWIKTRVSCRTVIAIFLRMKLDDPWINIWIFEKPYKEKVNTIWSLQLKVFAHFFYYTLFSQRAAIEEAASVVKIYFRFDESQSLHSAL